MCKHGKHRYMINSIRHAKIHFAGAEMICFVTICDSSLKVIFYNTALHSQKAVTANLKSQQLLSLGTLGDNIATNTYKRMI